MNDDIEPIERKRVARAFGAALRDARRERGISQEALAGEGGFDRTYPSMLERGLRTPTILVVLLLAKALRIDPVRLFADTVSRLRGKEA